MRNRLVRIAIAATFCAAGVQPALADELRTEANRANASAGEFGASIATSAMITVAVTLYSEPVPNLGATVGDGTRQIILPAGWILTTTSAPPGGCAMMATQFVNLGGGLYNIRVVPSSYPLNCTWLRGDYVYAIQIDVAQPNGYFQHVGTTLGTLKIP